MITIVGKSPVLATGATIPLSQAVRAGDFLFLSGQLGLDDSGKIMAEDIEMSDTTSYCPPRNRSCTGGWSTRYDYQNQCLVNR